MTHRVTLDVPASGTDYGIPFVRYSDANATTIINSIGEREVWSGIELKHKPEPGSATGTATMGVYKQSDDSLVAEINSTGTIYLYYPNNDEYGNANLTANQGICEWDTYYYVNVVPNNAQSRREQLIIRNLTTTTSL